MTTDHGPCSTCGSDATITFTKGDEITAWYCQEHVMAAINAASGYKGDE